MKGIVFSEFLDWAEAHFTPATVDQAILKSDTSTGGAYTSVGTYDHRELMRLVQELATLTRTPTSELVRGFGEHLFQCFHENYPDFFSDVDNAFDFLSDVEDHIHVEVLKLYPDAELPHFEYRRPGDDSLEITYRSDRRLGDLAEGLIRGCIAHFGQNIVLDRKEAHGGATTFLLKLVREAVPCTSLN